MKKKRIKWWIVPIILLVSAGLVLAYFLTKPEEQSATNSNPIKELKRNSISKGYYTLRAFVVSQEQCVCPENALCEPCYNWITISDVKTPPEDNTKLSPNQLRIYTDEAGMFNNGIDYEFKLFISDPSKHSNIDYPNGIDLVEYN